jgi:heterodisulfide reductase subunit B
MIVTPCQLCQTNVEIYQSEINKKQGTKFSILLVYYSQLMSVAYGGSAKQAGLDERRRNCRTSLASKSTAPLPFLRMVKGL